MNSLKLTIHNIKSIKHGIIELPMNNGVYAIVGNNGSGKSTIMYCLAQLMNKYSLLEFGVKPNADGSYVQFNYGNRSNKFIVEYDRHDRNKINISEPQDRITMQGMYEGSFFFGYRFKQYEKVRSLLQSNSIKQEHLDNADEYIVKQLGLILHGDSDYYKLFNLKTMKNKGIVKDFGLKETPYFFVSNSALISQYEMSSGECLMISLLHFIYHAIVRRSLDVKRQTLMLIDEIEVALHPIAVSRLMDLLHEIADTRDNLTIILTTHSPEIIRKISPNNMFKIENSPNTPVNTLDVINPCYPAYAIRAVYDHDGYDNLILVEDELAQIVVKERIAQLNLANSRLVNVLPAGGWRNICKLAITLKDDNILGAARNVTCILDGDIEHECKRAFPNLPKLFLPFPSIEKYLKKELIENKSPLFKKLNDQFFTTDSLQKVISNYKHSLGNYHDNDGKKLYQTLLSYLQGRKVSAHEFVKYVANYMKATSNFGDFDAKLKNMLG